MSRNFDISEQKVSKTTEKAVADLRIKSIENGIRSISSMLDTRTLHELDSIERKNHKLEKKLQDKKLNARRGNNLSHEALLNQGAMALQALRAGGIEVAQTTEEYGDEEKIWKHKFRTPTYNQKRIFDNPRLHEYYCSLNTEEQREFRIQCRDSLYKLSADLRAQLAESKQEMDSKGVFHPSANAHRAHCAYLLKLYKMVDASTVEDPVLKAMKRDDPRCDNEGTELLAAKAASSRAPVSRPTTSSSQRQRDPLRRVTSSRSEKRRPLLSMLTSVPPESGGGLSGPEDHEQAVTTKDRDSAGRPAPKGGSIDPISRQGSRKLLERNNSARVGSPDTSKRPQSKSGAGTAVEAGLGMDSFIEGASSDWMVRRLQQEQMDSSVAISGNQLSTPLPSRSDGIVWKHIPDLNERPKTATDDRPVISFDEFQSLFQKVLADAEAEAASIAEASRMNTDSSAELEDTKSALSHASDYVPPQETSSKDHLPAVKTKSSSYNRAGTYGHRKYQAKNATFLGNMSDPTSQKIVASMQPHLDAFVGMKTKKRYNLESVNKMLSTLPKSAVKSESLKPKTDDEDKKRPVSKVGFRAVRAQTAKPTMSGTSTVLRRKGADGFRNIFQDDESTLALDEKSLLSASLLESQTTASNSSDDEYSTTSEDDSRPSTANSGGGMGVRMSVVGKLGRQKRGMTKSQGAQVMQELQMTIWETLQVPTEERIAIMSKYSTEMFAKVFEESIALWTDVAIMVICRIELKKLYVTYQRGLLEVDSDQEDFFFRKIFDKVPKQLKSTYNPSVRYRRKTGPDAHVFALFEEIKGYLLIEEDPREIDRYDALNQMYEASKRIDVHIARSLEDAETRFFDTIPFGGVSCKEWLGNKAQKFPIPK